jgi:hypothetical protein
MTEAPVGNLIRAALRLVLLGQPARRTALVHRLW